jgi:phosphatidylinositol glycan class V
MFSAARNAGIFSYDGLESMIAILIAHMAHLLSTIVLYKLTLAVFGRECKQKAFVAAALHIFAPAGIFLSAPYAESCCAFLSFAGYLYYAKSFSPNGGVSVGKDVMILMSGIMFGAATTYRSNGMLNGVLLLEEAIRLAYQFLHDSKSSTFRRLVVTGLGGVCVGAGFVLPQFVAYQEYCTAPSSMIERRTWCGRIIPSIYNFVQDHYW